MTVQPCPMCPLNVLSSPAVDVVHRALSTARTLLAVFGNYGSESHEQLQMTLEWAARTGHEAIHALIDVPESAIARLHGVCDLAFAVMAASGRQSAVPGGCGVCGEPTVEDTSALMRLWGDVSAVEGLQPRVPGVTAIAGRLLDGVHEVMHLPEPARIDQVTRRVATFVAVARLDLTGTVSGS